jgi:polyhydroxyalkanoate synthesis regulator phasin
LDQLQTQTEIDMGNDILSLDGSLRSVWDKVQSAVLLINELRIEKSSLTSRVTELERQLSALRNDLLARDQELKKLRTEQAHLVNVSRSNGFSEEEKEEIKRKIRDIISKINSYL